jgi:zinc/manganese transport system permease protein
VQALTILAAPAALCVVLAGIHVYLGIHVLARGVIFVDLALAQVAAFGAGVAIVLGYDLHGPQAYFLALGATFVGAWLIALTRGIETKVPQEAIIGVVYAGASAMTILAVDRAAHGAEEIKALLVGSILFANWKDVGIAAGLYSAIGLFHWIARDRFLGISMDPEGARAKGWRVRLWDFFFYVSFGFVVTSSVRIAGVLLVFSYLVVPSIVGLLFLEKVRARLLLGWSLALVVSAAGLWASWSLDLPTGAAVVAAFAVALGIALTIRGLRSPRPA